MKYVYEILLDYVGDLFKLIILVTIVIVLLQYTGLYIVAYKTMVKAEEDGFLDENIYLSNINSLSFDTSDVKVDLVSPSWGEKVYKLGDPLTLVITKEYTTRIFGKDISVPMTVKREGINHGYYGEGYGDYGW